MAIKQTTGKLQGGPAGAGATTLTNAFPSAITPGSTLLLTIFHYNSGAAGISSVTIGGDTATLDNTVGAIGGVSFARVYRVQVASGTNRDIVINWTGGTDNYYTAAASEWDQFAASPYDSGGSGTATGSSGSATVTGAGNTAQASNLVVAQWVAGYGAVVGVQDPPTGYTSLVVEQDNNNQQAGEAAYKTTSAVATESATWSLGVAGAWGAILSVYKLSASSIFYKNSWTNFTAADPCVVSGISVAAGDLLLAFMQRDISGADARNWPSGFTEIASGQSTVDGGMFAVAYKVATGSETSLSFSIVGGNAVVAGVIAYGGVDTTTPLDVAGVGGYSNTGSTTHDISITPVTNGARLVFLSGPDTTATNATFAWSTQSGTTETWATRIDGTSTNNFYNVGVADAGQATAGAVTARVTWGASYGPMGVLVALRPTAGGGGGPSNGASTQTLGGFTETSAGTVDLVGSSIKAAGSFSGSATGYADPAPSGFTRYSTRWLNAPWGSWGWLGNYVSGPAPSNGDSNRTLGSFTGSAAGTVEVTGSSVKTTNAFTGSAAGTVASSNVISLVQQPGSLLYQNWGSGAWIAPGYSQLTGVAAGNLLLTLGSWWNDTYSPGSAQPLPTDSNGTISAGANPNLFGGPTPYWPVAPQIGHTLSANAGTHNVTPPPLASTGDGWFTLAEFTANFGTTWQLVTSATNVASSGTPGAVDGVTVTTDSTPLTGDLIVALVHTDGDPTAVGVGAPSGYTTLASTSTTSVNVGMGAGYKIATSDGVQTAAWTWADNDCQIGFGAIAVYRRVTITTINGSSVKTFGAFTGSAAGTVLNNGASTQTLAVFTETSTGTVDIAGVSNKTLAVFTGAGAGTVDIAGVSNKTPSNFTGSAAGTVLNNGASTQTGGAFTGGAAGSVGSVPISGDSVKTISNVTGVNSGTVEVAGTSAKSTGSFTGSGAGTATIGGSSVSTLGTFTETSDGTVGLSGSSIRTIADVTSVAAGTISLSGSSIRTAANFTGVADGVVGAAPITGDSNKALGSFTGNAAGTNLVSGISDKVLGSFGRTSAGTVGVAGDSQQTISNVGRTSQGTVLVTGNSAQSLAQFTASGAAQIEVRGISSKSIAPITGSAIGGEVTLTLTDDRTHKIVFENRTLAVPLEDRVRVIALEDRKYSIPAQPRQVTL